MGLLIDYFNGETVWVWEKLSGCIPHLPAICLFIHTDIELIHVSKMGPQWKSGEEIVRGLLTVNPQLRFPQRLSYR